MFSEIASWKWATKNSKNEISKRWTNVTWCAYSYYQQNRTTGITTISNSRKKWFPTQDTTYTTYTIISLQLSTTPQKEIRTHTELSITCTRVITHVIFFFLFLGVGRDRVHFSAATVWPIVPDLDDRWRWMSSFRWNENWDGKPKCSEKTCLSASLSTANSTWPDLGLEPGRLCAKPATNRLARPT
jgi:hypothetical protein